MWSKILHHHIQLASNLIYNQCDALPTSVDKQQLSLIINVTYRQRQDLGKHRQSIHVIPHQYGRTTCKCCTFEIIQASYRLDHNRRNGKLLPTGFDHHSTLDRQASWELHGKCRPLTRHGFDFQRASQTRYTIAHNVQTYTTTTFFA